MSRLSPEWLEVLGDEREGRGLGRRPLWLQEHASASAYTYAVANAYADADAAASVYAEAAVPAYASADAYANAEADAYADADAYTGTGAFADVVSSAHDRNVSGTPTAVRRINMKTGIYAVALVQGSTVVLRVGWFRPTPEDPDEYECHWVTPYRGEAQTRLAEVWLAGPSKAPNWEWSPVVESVCHRLHIRPLAKLDPEKWSAVCPKPAGWGS